MGAAWDVRWTQSEEADLRRLWNADCPTAQISNVIGRSRGSILGKARLMNLPIKLTRNGLPPDQSRATRAEIEARRREIPEDTRSMTACLMGDPLPGRSALDRRVAA